MAVHGCSAFVTALGTTAQGAAMIRGVVSHLFPDKRGQELQTIVMQFARIVPQATVQLLENGQHIGPDRSQSHYAELMAHIAHAPTCAHPDCTMQKALRRCNRCKAVMYCGEEHQRAHWQEHKAICTIIAQAAAEAKAYPDCQIQ